MRNIFTRALGVALIVATPVALVAQPQPTPSAKPGTKAPANNQSGKAPQAKPAASKPGSTQQGQYGTWNNSWGKAPSAPPAHWTKKGDWYHHVRACQQRYKSYSSKTDTYRTLSGKNLRCKL